jgi:hypothetical protein
MAGNLRTTTLRGLVEMENVLARLPDDLDLVEQGGHGLNAEARPLFRVLYMVAIVASPVQ